MTPLQGSYWALVTILWLVALVGWASFIMVYSSPWRFPYRQVIGMALGLSGLTLLVVWMVFN